MKTTNYRDYDMYPCALFNKVTKLEQGLCFFFCCFLSLTTILAKPTQEQEIKRKKKQNCENNKVF